MGYGSKGKGQIVIVPPLTAVELRAHPEFLTREQDVAIEISKTVTPTEDGELVRQSGIYVFPVYPDESFSRYHFNDELQEIVDAYPDHDFTGRIEWTGEDGAIWATVVRKGRVKDIQPKIVWPDDEEQ